jgi:hypothetical protein
MMYDESSKIGGVGKTSEWTQLTPRVMATSRGERQNKEQLGPIADYSINIQSAIVDEDIRVYIRDRLATVSKLKKCPQAVQNEIITVIMKKAGGHLPSRSGAMWREAQYNDDDDDDDV